MKQEKTQHRFGFSSLVFLDGVYILATLSKAIGGACYILANCI
jgi:hypothetical protein